MTQKTEIKQGRLIFDMRKPNTDISNVSCEVSLSAGQKGRASFYHKSNESSLYDILKIMKVSGYNGHTWGAVNALAIAKNKGYTEIAEYLISKGSN